ncbi:MAG: hypothetical protein GXY38_03865 [Planctomycetes bacterium]|nr:hypothetical protein [Planctomycetota bacterium]
MCDPLQRAELYKVWWGWSNSWAGGDSTLAASATDYPSFAYNDRHQNTPTTPGMCELQGLNKALTYDITVYGSRGVVSNDRVRKSPLEASRRVTTVAGRQAKVRSRSRVSPRAIAASSESTSFAPRTTGIST